MVNWSSKLELIIATVLILKVQSVITENVNQKYEFKEYFAYLCMNIKVILKFIFKKNGLT